MREDVANVDYLPAILNDHDEAVLVATDIEHDELPNRVSMPKIPPSFARFLPNSAKRASVSRPSRFKRNAASVSTGSHVSSGGRSSFHCSTAHA
jgi:hypothetical protein